MKLNCDLGEGFGHYKVCDTAQIMPFIHQANIACGMHAGDPDEIINTIQLARANNVQIGAHPSYPDRQGFGRRHMSMKTDELYNLLTYQIGLIAGLCERFGTRLSYVKPHGALYHDMVNVDAIRRTVFKSIADFPMSLSCVVPANLSPAGLVAGAERYQLSLQFEVFADRAYQANGLLVPRTDAGAVLSQKDAIKQAVAFAEGRPINSQCGQPLLLHADTLCVHSDTPDALSLIKKLHANSAFSH